MTDLRISAEQLVRVVGEWRRARALGVEVSPGPGFAADRTLTHYLRLPYTPPPSALDRVVAVLGAACGP
jgi:hypothetical protein